MESKYSYLNQLSTEQLENLLTSQRSSPADEDEAFCDAIEEVILQRETLHATGRLGSVDAAWTEFQKHYNTPEGDGLSLYPDDPDFGDPQTPHTAPPLQHFSKTRRMMRRGLIAAAIVTVLFAGMIAAQASGLDIFGAIARWTSETFHFTSSEAPVTSGRNSNLSETSQALRTAFRDSGMDESMIPGWYPERYELVDIKTVSLKNVKLVTLNFEDEADSFTISCADYKSSAAIDFQIFEKDADSVEEYISGNRLFYLMTNLDHISGAWADGSTMISISGNLTGQELKTIIDNIGD